MPSVYGQLTKISNAVGRSEYITNGEKQEEIVLHEVQMKYDWQTHSVFEREHSQSGQKNNEALEVIVPLPNELYQDKEKLKAVCDSLCREIFGANKDYEYAVHWNASRTNLHMHVIFSERENVLDLNPKTYKKDIWQDKDTGKLAKANSENAVLVHRKGEVQKDKDGNIKYNSDIFGAKDIRFKNKNFVTEKNHAIGRVFQEYGFDFRVQTKDSPYLSQKKLYKGDSDSVKKYRAAAEEYNAAVRSYNQAVKEHIELRPETEPTYQEIKKSVEADIKTENSKTRSISNGAITVIKEMRDFVREQISRVKSLITETVYANKTAEWWSENKERIVEAFRIHTKNDMDLVTLNALQGKLSVTKSELEKQLEEAQEHDYWRGEYWDQPVGTVINPELAANTEVETDTNPNSNSDEDHNH